MAVNSLIGKKFNRLTVIEKAGKKYGITAYLCRCDCGNEVVLTGSSLTTGNTKSCGCYAKEIQENSERRRKDKMYHLYYGIKTRCYNPNSPEYKNYGERGIKMCDEWLNDFAVFKNWMLEHGYDYSKSNVEQQIDRIDNNGDYSPDNCHLVTCKQNCRNTRQNLYLTYNGETLTAVEWAEKLGVPASRIRDRMNRWSDPYEILFAPVDPPRSNTGIKGITYNKAHGTYLLCLKKKYIGEFKTLEEAVKRKEEYLLEISKNITRQNTNQDGRCGV